VSSIDIGSDNKKYKRQVEDWNYAGKKKEKQADNLRTKDELETKRRP